MFFLFYLSIAQCKRVLDNPYPTPEVYPIAVSTRQMKKVKVAYNSEPFDPECPFDDLSSITNINCGQRCWSDYGTGFLEYSFKGVQFVLYGKKAPNHGTFDLIINESDPIEITETSEQTDVYALLYPQNIYRMASIEYKSKARVPHMSSLDFHTGPKSMIVSFCGEVIFEDNDVQYSDKTKTCAAFSLSVSKSLSLSRSNFTNCITSLSSSILLTNQKDDSTTSIKSCNFINCKSSNEVIVISGGSVEVDDCLVSFENNNIDSACCAIKFLSKGLTCKNSKFVKTYSNGSIEYNQPNGKTDPILVTNCIFDDCGGINTRCFNLVSRTEDFTFSHNIIQNMKATNTLMGYFGLIGSHINKMKNFEFNNVTFKDNTCRSEYGGGSGLWVTGTEKITFNNCKFINNIALKSVFKRSRSPVGMNYFAADGGAIQYGHSTSIYNVDMIFNLCTFTRNKAVRHGGAIAIQTCQKVEITECTFEENVANYKDSSSQLLYSDYYNLKEEGRGGAIYINPVFTYNNKNHNPEVSYLKEITISKCKFISNSAFDGYAIYIEGDDPGTKFIIKDNTFTGNYDISANSKERGIITSEIENLYDGNIISSNTFNDKNIIPVLYVDHRGRTPDPTPMATPTQSPTPMATPIETTMDDANCGTRCYYVESSDIEGETGNVVKIIKKSFNSTSSNSSESGGAVYFINCGLYIENSEFDSCQSTAGGGGAIYIDNDKELRNEITIKSAYFTGCKSYYGGAVYVRSRSENVQVLIANCTFESNMLLDRKENEKFGGSAVYFYVRNGNVESCKFNKNKGKGGALKIMNDFDSEKSFVKNLLGLHQNRISINDCSFDDKDQSSSSIYYVGGKHASKLDVTNCVFTGILNKGTHYIDGHLTAKESPKISVKTCVFNGDQMSAFNSKNDFISIDLNNQVFGSSNQKSNEDKYSYKILYLAAVPTLAVLAIVAVVFAVKKIKKSDKESEEDLSQIL